MGAVFEKEYGSVEWIKWKPNGEEFRNDRARKEDRKEGKQWQSKF